MRALIAAKLYVFAFVCIWAAMTIAPDMTWPVTDTEWLASKLLVVGLIAKLGGHVVLWPRVRA